MKYLPEQPLQRIRKYFFRIDEVAEIFMEMVEDDTKNGLILTCAKNTGTKYGTLALQTV